jgi:hypothetical protein
LAVAVVVAVMVMVAVAGVVAVVDVALIVTVLPDGIAGGAINMLLAALAVVSGVNEKDPHATAGVQLQVT